MTAHEGPVRGPWWASGADDLAEEVDPFEAHRRARGGDDEPPPSAGDASRTGVEDALEVLAALVRAAARRGSRRGGAGDRGHDPTCRSCAWCVLTRSLGDARPEVAEHLELAARHVVLAARAWVDAADERTGGWEAIPLDDEEEP